MFIMIIIIIVIIVVINITILSFFAGTPYDVFGGISSKF